MAQQCAAGVRCEGPSLFTPPMNGRAFSARVTLRGRRSHLFRQTFSRDQKTFFLVVLSDIINYQYYCSPYQYSGSSQSLFDPPLSFAFPATTMHRACALCTCHRSCGDWRFVCGYVCRREWKLLSQPGSRPYCCIRCLIYPMFLIRVACNRVRASLSSHYCGPCVNQCSVEGRENCIHISLPFRCPPLSSHQRHDKERVDKKSEGL